MKRKKTIKSRAKSFKIMPILLAFGIFIVALAIFFLLFSQNKEKTYKTYFIKNDQVFALEEKLSEGADPLQKGLIRLINGPSREEQARGISTYLPQKTKINGIKKQGGALVIDFNSELENISGGSDRIIKMIEQIVYTATEAPGINKVWFFVNGRKNVVLGGEGYELLEPVGREEIMR